MLNLRFDKQGLIIQTDDDGGDCAARTGELYILLHDNFTPDLRLIWFSKALRLLSPVSGILLRYTEPPYNSPFTGDFATSRDQTRPMVIAAGFYGEKKWIKQNLKQIIENGWRYHNGDFCTPEDLAIYWRAYKMAGRQIGLTKGEKLFLRATSWVRHLGAVYTLGNSITRCIAGRHWDDVGDDINHVLVSYQATQMEETSLDRYSRDLYRMLRPYGVQHAFDHYHRPESNGNPLNILAKPIIERYFNGD